MSIDGSGADAGPPGDLVDGHRQPVGRERGVGNLQHPGTVPCRIRTHLVITSQPIDKTGRAFRIVDINRSAYSV